MKTSGGSSSRRLLVFVALIILVLSGSYFYVRRKQLAAFDYAGLRQVQENVAVAGKNVPIEFYGRVVDQDGVPLSGVRVEASIRGWSVGLWGNPKGTFPILEARSDTNGRFEIKGGRGDVLTIVALEKIGYEPEPFALRSFGYNISTNITPDPKAPIVLKMWKQEIRSRLLTKDKHFSIIPDGRVYTVDLLKGVASQSGAADGDLRVWIQRATNAAWGGKYDWSFSITAIDGGLAEEPDRYAAMFMAPEQGYTNQWALSFKASDKHWSYLVANKHFFVKSREGRLFGRMHLEVQPFFLADKQGTLWLRYTLNPEGSRVLR